MPGINSPIPIVNTTVETTIVSQGWVIPNILAGQAFDATLAGRIGMKSSGGTITFRLYVNGMLLDSVVVNNKNIVNLGCIVRFLSTIRSLGMAGQMAGVIEFLGEDAGFVWSGMVAEKIIVVDTTGAITVAISAQWAVADPANSFIAQHGYIVKV